MGIRATAARVEVLDPYDRTLKGTYWFDLRTRRPGAARVKRIIDLFGAAALMVLLAPLLLLIAALVKLTSAGPAVFVQRRIGFRCNEFGMYRFTTSDHRITRWLQRSRLDDLPQLFNVIEGTMSLVGPRPLLDSDLDRLPMGGQMRRFSVPPGITGLAQVSAPASDAERMELDRKYINEWSLGLDLRILARTIAVVLGGRRAD